MSGCSSRYVWLFPSFRLAVFGLTRSCTRQDREHARSLFLTAAGEPTPLHTSFLSAVATGSAAPSLVPKTFEPGVEPASVEKAAAGKAGRLLTKEEKERVRKAIEGAESVEEVSRIRFGFRCACRTNKLNVLPSTSARRSAASSACSRKVSCMSLFSLSHTYPPCSPVSRSHSPTEKDLRDLDRQKSRTANGNAMQE